jgi:hypothetical protein
LLAYSHADDLAPAISLAVAPDVEGIDLALSREMLIGRSVAEQMDPTEGTSIELARVFADYGQFIEGICSPHASRQDALWPLFQAVEKLSKYHYLQGEPLNRKAGHSLERIAPIMKASSNYLGISLPWWPDYVQEVISPRLAACAEAAPGPLAIASRYTSIDIPSRAIDSLAETFLWLVTEVRLLSIGWSDSSAIRAAQNGNVSAEICSAYFQRLAGEPHALAAFTQVCGGLPLQFTAYPAFAEDWKFVSGRTAV